MQILPVAAGPAGFLVSILSLVARSYAGAELRNAPPEGRYEGRWVRLPPLPAAAGSFVRRAPPAALFVAQGLSRRPRP